MHKTIKLIAILSCLLVFASACGLFGGEDKKKNGIPGKIVFSQLDENSITQIFTMNPDGTNLVQLTHFTEAGAHSPSWSSDGRHIVFNSFKGGTSHAPAIWVMNANGDNQQFLYHPNSDNEHSHPISGNYPRWNPDGNKVAYWHTNIWIFDLLSKEQHQLTTHFGQDVGPSWSPDGSKIAFRSDVAYSSGDSPVKSWDMYIINMDSREVQRITENASVRSVSWNPKDERFITYTATAPDGEGASIYLFDLLENTHQSITTFKNAGTPQWHKDGKQILVAGITSTDELILRYMNSKGEILIEIPLEIGLVEYNWYSD